MYHQAGVPVLPDIEGTTGDAGPRGVGAPDPKGDYTCTQQHDAGSYRRASERSRRSSPRPHSRSAGSRWPRWPRQHQCRVRRPVRPRSTASARRPSHSPSTGRAARSRHRPTSSSSWPRYRLQRWAGIYGRRWRGRVQAGRRSLRTARHHFPDGQRRNDAVHLSRSPPLVVPNETGRLPPDRTCR